MHASVMAWVEQKVRENSLAQPDMRVLEVGSRNVNGSVRGLFDGVASYTGVDMIEGPGVDLVADAHGLTKALRRRKFDVVVSTEVLEHDEKFWLSLDQIRRVLRPGGTLLLTARGNGFMAHGYPYDYYRFMPESFPVLLALAGCEAIEITEDWHPGHPGLFAMGRRLPD